MTHRVIHKQTGDFGWCVRWDGDTTKLPQDDPYLSWEIEGECLVVKGTTVRPGYYLVRANVFGKGIVFLEVDAATLKSDWFYGEPRELMLSPRQAGHRHINGPGDLFLYHMGDGQWRWAADIDATAPDFITEREAWLLDMLLRRKRD